MEVKFIQIVFFVFGIIFGKFFLKWPKETNSSEGDSPEIITKKDYFYWIVFFTLFIIFFMSDSLSQDTVFSEYVSFAGTVTSIILGVVAIIYSYFQNFENMNSKESLDKTYSKLHETSSELQKNISVISQLSHELAKSNSEIKELNAQISILKDTILKMEQNIGNKIANVEKAMHKKDSPPVSTISKEIKWPSFSSSIGYRVIEGSDVEGGK